MKMFIATCVAVLGFAASAAAVQLSSPAIFGAHSQDIAQCAVTNVGTETVNVQMTILNESGGIMARRNDVVAPGQIVFVEIGIPFGVAHACVVTTPGAADLRAALNILERLAFGVTRPLRSAPLR
jgi:hypothetical protein